ncbi:MAG: hypothetical protein ACK4PI_13000 [Tepidisphaerales bacterium]
MNASTPPSSPGPAPPTPRTPRRWLLPLLLLIALAHAAIALLGVRGHAATFDEPVHLVAAAHAAAAQFHLNPEHPPLWKLLPGLTQPHPPPLPADVAGDPVRQWPYAVEQLYRSGHDADALLTRARVVMLVYPLATIVLGGLLVHALAGPAAAVLAALLLALDPLLLAHGPLVTNDVPLTLALLAVVAAAFLLRQRLARPTFAAALAPALLLGGLIGLAACTKFTAVVLAPLLAAAVVLFPARHDAPRRLARAAPALVLAAAFAFATVWAVYGFRYRPSADAPAIDLQPLVERIAQLRRLADAPFPTGPDAADSPLPPPDLATRLLVALDRHHLLPNAFVAGLLTSYGVTRSNPAFLFGQLSTSGWTWYFPAAALVKTPLALLAAYAMLLWTLPRPHAPPAARGLGALALLVFAVAAASPLNIGVRHVLPALALLTLAAAVVLARTPRLAAALLVALAAEVTLSYPHLISFFNAPARVVGPERLLADSNLDWGQDLKRLAEWHHASGRPRLLVAYWGTADPAFYGLAGPDVLHLPNTYPYLPQHLPPPPRGDGSTFLAVSVSYLQGIQSGEVAPFFRRLRDRPVVHRVGTTIHIYPW